MPHQLRTERAQQRCKSVTLVAITTSTVGHNSGKVKGQKIRLAKASPVSLANCMICQDRGICITTYALAKPSFVP